MWQTGIAWAERGWIPDLVLRAGIRLLVRQRLSEEAAHDPELSAEREHSFFQKMSAAPIALVPEKANEQHYEVPAEFFQLVLGPNRKYSCCYWDERSTDLAKAEENALRITCERAGLRDGMRVLDLGCGWGSLSLWIARHYPRCEVRAVTNSQRQAEFLSRELAQNGIGNVQVYRADMNDFNAGEKFDRIVSVEMFEHMRNWPLLFQRIHSWLFPDGQLFLHIFTHRSVAYEYVPRSVADWMSRYFFTGGMMPSDCLPILCSQEHWRLVRRWRWGGHQYERTCRAWLRRMDDHRSQILPILAATYGTSHAAVWWHRWRIFFLACAEMFGFRGGREYGVGHYLFSPRS